MNEIKEEKTITMTEEQLERAIKMGVKTAVRELKKEAKLPGNEVNDLKDAPFTYFSIQIISIVFLLMVIGLFGCISIACIIVMFTKPFNIYILAFLIYSILITVTSGLSVLEIYKTKKAEVLNTFFSAIMALSSLIVAIVGTYFAYKSTK